MTTGRINQVSHREGRRGESLSWPGANQRSTTNGKLRSTGNRIARAETLTSSQAYTSTASFSTRPADPPQGEATAPALPCIRRHHWTHFHCPAVSHQFPTPKAIPSCASKGTQGTMHESCTPTLHTARGGRRRTRRRVKLP